ncbi:MAG: hypothetical protein ACM36B_14915, partial [Bacteroidota bacterium]
MRDRRAQDHRRGEHQLRPHPGEVADDAGQVAHLRRAGHALGDPAHEAVEPDDHLALLVVADHALHP